MSEELTAICGGAVPDALAGQIWVPMVQGQDSRWEMSPPWFDIKADLLKYFGSHGRPLYKAN